MYRKNKHCCYMFLRRKIFYFTVIPICKMIIYGFKVNINKQNNVEFIIISTFHELVEHESI